MQFGVIFLTSIHSNTHPKYHYYFYYPNCIGYCVVAGTIPAPTTKEQFHYFYFVIFVFLLFQLPLIVNSNKIPNCFSFYNYTITKNG